MMQPVHFEVFDARNDRENISVRWEYMLSQSDHSFFLSSEWIETWLESLPSQVEVLYIEGYLDNEPCLAFFLCKKKKLRFKFVPTRSIFLNCTGSQELDELTIEYNSFLINQSLNVNFSCEVIRQTIIFLSDNWSWDKFVLPATTHQMYKLFKTIEFRGYSLSIDKVEPSYFVDLSRVRKNNENYLGLLSSNKRSQIKRSIKEYEKSGAIYLQEASSVNESISMLNNLAKLHQAEWIKKGKPGSFSNDYFCKFHELLLKKTVVNDNVQLLEIRNNADILGYIYNFVYQNNVLFYQSGFQYLDGNHYRPGIVSHYLSIKHNAAKGYASYDFLAGKSRYKTSLSTDQNQLYWLTLKKKNIKFFIKCMLKKIKAWIIS